MTGRDFVIRHYFVEFHLLLFHDIRTTAWLYMNFRVKKKEWKREKQRLDLSLFCRVLLGATEMVVVAGRCSLFSCTRTSPHRTGARRTYFIIATKTFLCSTIFDGTTDVS